MDNDVKRKIDFVDQYIDIFVRKLAENNKNLQEKLKTNIREIILQNDLKSSSEEISSLLKILSDENSQPDLVRVKEVILELTRWVEKNIDSVRTYRGEYLKTALLEETLKDNPNIKEEQIKNTIQLLVDNLQKVYGGDGGIEDQNNLVLSDNKKESVGKIRNALNDIRGIVGLAKLTPEQFEEVFNNNEKITAELQKYGIKIPYSKFDELASYDRTMNLFKKPELRQSLESSKSRFKILGGKFSHTANNFISKIKGEKAKKLANNIFNKQIVKTSNGFASRIGNQNASVFVKNSINTLFHVGFGGGIETIVRGFSDKNGNRSNITIGTNNGLSNLATSGANLFKNSTARVFDKLGIGTKNFLGKSFDKVGGSLIKGLNSAVSLPTKLTSSMGIKIVAPVLIGFFVVAWGLDFFETRNISSTVVLKIDEDSGNNGGGGGTPSTPGSDGLILNGPTKCSVANKTVATWQCAGENNSTYFGGPDCVTSVTSRRRSVCTSGCGLVSTSIILQAHDPKYTPKYILENTSFKSYGNICGSGVGWSMIFNTIKSVLGADSLIGDRAVGCNKEWISNQICEGNVVIVLFGHRPTGGHWVTAVAVMENGDIALKDPGYGRGTNQFNYLSRYLANKEKNPFIRNCLAVKGDSIKNTQLNK